MILVELKSAADVVGAQIHMAAPGMGIWVEGLSDDDGDSPSCAVRSTERYYDGQVRLHTRAFLSAAPGESMA